MSGPYRDLTASLIIRDTRITGINIWSASVKFGLSAASADVYLSARN